MKWIRLFFFFFLYPERKRAPTMAACATHSSLMLAYAARSQDLTPPTPSLFSFASSRPNHLSVPLLLLGGSRDRRCDRASNRAFQVIVSAVAAEADLDTEEQDLEQTATAVLDPPKPKKGKAALVLKRDRVYMLLLSIFTYLYLFFNLMFLLFYSLTDKV